MLNKMSAEAYDLNEGVKEKVFIKTKNMARVMPIEDIVYLEAMGNDTIIVTNKGYLVTNKSLKKWEEQLRKSNFYRCHKLYLVSLDKVDMIEDGKIYIEVGNEKKHIKVSVRKRNEIKRNLQMLY